MKIKLCSFFIVFAILQIILPIANAEVRTEKTLDENSVCIAGNRNFYPVEYYNSETKQFEGVIPEILKRVSKNTGIDFTYIDSDSVLQTELVATNQAELVSAYVTDTNSAFAVDDVRVFSYTDRGKTVNIGLAFTEFADDETIKAIKQEISQITGYEINGYFVEAGHSKHQNTNMITTVLLICCVIFALIAMLVCIRLKRMTRQIDIKKMTDDETGMGNLAYFENQFKNTIPSELRTSYYIAYIIIDSNFLQFYHGETVFIDAVQYAATILNENLKKGDFAARITESGFALAFRQSDDDKANKYIKDIIKKLNISIKPDDKNVKTIFHATVYNLHKDDYNCELILFNLRRNCGKIVGTDTKLVFCDAHTMNRAIEERALTESFLYGFENKEFKLYLQFVVDNKTKNIVSAEALSRWDNREKGLLAPGLYIETMELVGMISELDFYMFEMVCIQLHKWHDTEFGFMTISCNFTRITLSENNFIERLTDITSKYIFDRSKLIIEITEDAIEKNIKNALDNVRECKKMGFVIALDDMGSGYTSLSNLCDYPIDIVKIDKDILSKIGSDTGKELFGGMVALAHSLNKKVVCEGVETEEQNEFVGASECDLIQGWYYSKALPVEESEDFYRNYCSNK